MRCPSLLSSTGARVSSRRLSPVEELGIQDQVTIIGIAKRLEEIFFPQDPVPLYLDKKGNSLKIIQHLRDEAHRFGIRFHRQKRSQSFTVSELEGIKGIGPRTAQILLEKYGSA